MFRSPRFLGGAALLVLSLTAVTTVAEASSRLRPTMDRGLHSRSQHFGPYGSRSWHRAPQAMYRTMHRRPATRPYYAGFTYAPRPVYVPRPVYARQPVYAPAYAEPAYAEPAYAQPIYQQPLQNAPVTRAVYNLPQPPVYRSPVSYARSGDCPPAQAFAPRQQAPAWVEVVTTTRTRIVH